MIPFFVDTETYSSVRMERGLDQYLTGVEPMIATYCREEQPVSCWDITDGSKMPSELEDNLLDERVTLVAHNAQFDRNVIHHGLKIETPINRWWCTMAQAYAHALPGSLEALGPAVGIPGDMQKIVAGKKLIDLFCISHKGRVRANVQTHPVEWAKFLAYAIQDTGALRELFKRLPKHNYVNEHYDLWVLDQEINERGFFTDQEMCRQAVIIRDSMRDHLNREVNELTSGVITKGTQRERILHYMVGEYGFIMLDMKKETIKKMLDEDKTLTPDARRLLELRRDSALTSLTKYERALERVGTDGRMRYTLQYAGAGRTGRHAGRGIQPHNMPRPKRKADEIINVIVPAILDGTLPQKVDDVNQACSDALRSMIIAEPGNELLVGDWSNIEGRCLAWEAEAAWKLRAFEANDAGTGPDLYVLLYSASFGVDIDAVSDKQRQMGKGMELSMGFGGGVGAFTNVATSYGLNLDELGVVVPDLVSAEIYNKADVNYTRAFVRGEDLRLEPAVYIACDALKQVWRKQNPEIVQLWWDVERAVKWAIERPGSVHYVARCKIWRTPAWLVIELPSTRRLLYAQPQVRLSIEYDEETGEIEERPVIRYMAAKNKQWHRERTYGGKIVENITQAIANDILRASLLRADAEGYPQVLHVHDEQVAETPLGLFDLDDFLRLMEVPPPWLVGMPLKAAGYAATRYKKD